MARVKNTANIKRTVFEGQYIGPIKKFNRGMLRNYFAIVLSP